MRSIRINSFYRLLLYPIFILLLFSLSRILLWFLNTDLFPELSIGEFALIWVGGFRFDISTLAFLHIPTLLFLMIPFTLRNKKWYKITLIAFLTTINSIVVIPNLIDLVFFRFTLKRLSADIFSMLFSISDEMTKLTSDFLTDYWYIILLFILFIALFFFATRFSFCPFFQSNFKIKWWKQVTIIILCSAIIFISSRGTFQVRPLDIIDSSKIAGTDFAPLVCNSSFSILKTYGKEQLSEIHYYKDEEVNRIFPYGRNYFNPKDTSIRPNIVLIIVESLSAEHMGCLNNGLPSYTPFLDSLANYSLIFKRMYSNGLISLDGIPAILCGLPPLLNGSISTSMYSGNQLPGIGLMLKEAGYKCSFFHGGRNGTMNFDGLSFAAGYEKYYGKNQYTGPESDFDGKWGIFDEPWLQFMANKLDEFKEPFHSTVFTLSSHHPYTLPEQHKHRFTKGNEVQKCIQYADYSLKRFFETVSKKSWYRNTVFIITADHTGELMNSCFSNSPGSYAIPMIWFYPGDTTLIGENTETCQQIDIMPSIADYLNLNQTVYGFGQSVFDKSLPRYAILYINKIYRMIINSKVLDYDGQEIIHYKDELDCRGNTPYINHNQDEELRLLKAIIQQFNNHMISNTLR